MFSCFNLVSSDIDNDPPSIIIGGLLLSGLGVPLGVGVGVGVPGGDGGGTNLSLHDESEAITGIATSAEAAVFVKRRRDGFFGTSSESFIFVAPLESAGLSSVLFRRMKSGFELIAIKLNVWPVEIAVEMIPQSFLEVRQ